MCYLAEHLGKQPKIVEVANTLYNFIRDSFYDPSSWSFVYIVSPDGREKLEPGKQLYANMHAVAAFAYYGRVFGHEEALQIALAVRVHGVRRIKRPCKVFLLSNTFTHNLSHSLNASIHAPIHAPIPCPYLCLYPCLGESLYTKPLPLHKPST